MDPALLLILTLLFGPSMVFFLITTLVYLDKNWLLEAELSLLRPRHAAHQKECEGLRRTISDLSAANERLLRIHAAIQAALEGSKS